MLAVKDIQRCCFFSKVSGNNNTQRVDAHEKSVKAKEEEREEGREIEREREKGKRKDTTVTFTS